MIEAFWLEGCVDEYKFGYNTGLGGYTNSDLDMNKLGEIMGEIETKSILGHWALTIIAKV